MAVFKIASGYVEVKGIVDRVSVRQAADRFTRDVADQMETGTAFANSREGGRKMGGIYGEHAAPTAATGLSEGILHWIGQGTSASNARAAGGVLGDHVGAGARGTIGEHLTDAIDAWSISDVTHEVGRQLGKTLGEHVTEELTRVTETYVDKNGRERDSATGRFTGGEGRDNTSRSEAPADNGRRDGDRYSKSFLERVTDLLGTGIGAAFQAASSIAAPVLGTVGVALAAPVVVGITASLATGIGAAIIGGAGLGVIGAGALILKENERLQKAGDSLKKKFKSTMEDAASPLIGPFEKSMGIFEKLLDDIGPDLKGMFEAIAPAVEPLSEGFAEFIKNALPGFIDLVKAAEPFLQDLALTLPRLGEDIGVFLGWIAGEGPAATQFFRDFLNIVGLLIQGAGVWIGFFMNLYGAMRSFFGDVKDVIMGAFNWIMDATAWVGDKVEHFVDLVTGGFKAIVRDGGKSFIGWIKGIPGEIDNALGGVPGRILRALGNLGNLLWNAGSDLIGGLIRGIKAMIPNLTGVLGWITDKLPDWKGPEQKDKDVLYNSGRYVMQGFERGVRDETGGGVRGAFTDYTNRLPAMAMAGGGSTGPRGPMIGTLSITISSTLDDPTLPRVVAGRIFDAIERYKKDY